MQKFYINDDIHDDLFLALLVLATSDSPLYDSFEVERLLNSTYKDGHFLIDQILHSGNTDERFIEFELHNGKIVSDSINFLKIPKGSFIRQLSRKILCDNNLLEYSILSNIQKRMLEKGIAI